MHTSISCAFQICCSEHEGWLHQLPDLSEKSTSQAILTNRCILFHLHLLTTANFQGTQAHVKAHIFTVSLREFWGGETVVCILILVYGFVRILYSAFYYLFAFSAQVRTYKYGCVMGVSEYIFGASLCMSTCISLHKLGSIKEN